MPAVRAERRAERANIVPSTQQKTKEMLGEQKCVCAVEGRIDVDNDLRDVGLAWHALAFGWLDLRYISLATATC